MLGGHHQLAQQSERKRVVPVKVLEDSNDRSYTALAQQQADDSLVGGLPTLGRVERAERIVVFKCIEKIQHWPDRVLQGSVESQNLACHPLTDGLRIVVDVDAEIIPKQFDDRQVWRCATIRNGFGFQNQALPCVLRMNELANQARLTHPRFADECHHLTLTADGKLLRAAELFQLDVAADEAR